MLKPLLWRPHASGTHTTQANIVGCNESHGYTLDGSPIPCPHRPSLRFPPDFELKSEATNTHHPVVVLVTVLVYVDVLRTVTVLVRGPVLISHLVRYAINHTTLGEAARFYRLRYSCRPDSVIFRAPCVLIRIRVGKIDVAFEAYCEL